MKLFVEEQKRKTKGEPLEGQVKSGRPTILTTDEETLQSDLNTVTKKHSNRITLTSQYMTSLGGQITEEVLRRFEEANITVITGARRMDFSSPAAGSNCHGQLQKKHQAFFGEWLTEQMHKREETLKIIKAKADRNFKARKGPSHWLLAVTTFGEGNSLVVVDPSRLTTEAAPRFAFSNFDISFIKTGVQPATNNVICGNVVLFWALNMNHIYVSGSNLNIQDMFKTWLSIPPGWYAEVNALLQTRQQSFRFWTETNPNSLCTQDQPVEL